MKKENKGFTLIELLVVIAIIGILSAIGLVALNGAREKSRDSKRQTDLDQIRAAMVLYHDDNNGTYYDTTLPTAVRIDNGADAGFTTAMAQYVPNIPQIPKDTGNTDNDYWYINSSAGADYALASKLEGSQLSWYVINSLGFGGKVDKSSTGSGAGQDYDNTTLQCTGGSSTSSNLEVCVGAPSGV